MFFLKDFRSADYHHPLFGAVIRSGFSNHLMAKPDHPDSWIAHDGEWGALRYSSLLLHGRFNSEPQPYPDHIPKALSIPLLDEVNIIWSEEMSLAAIRGFRISKRGEGDIATVPLVQWLRMERWREAFLWTWIVGKMGGVEGNWGEEAKEELKRVLGVYGNSDRVTVSRRERQTKDEAPEMLKHVGWPQPKQTWIAFSSFDGHVSSNPQKPADSCRFTISKCLPDGFFTTSDTHTANDLFKHIAFAERSCGDCLITALVSASGDRGLHTILPDEEAVYHPPAGAGEGVWDTTEPVLPMTKTWEEASFGLEDVIRTGSDVWGDEEVSSTGVNLRKWCLKLLTRYNYAMGTSCPLFIQIDILMLRINKLYSRNGSFPFPTFQEVETI
jgi:3-O-alpha-D-mannopyranosyl-alpha-D-mannopyranose xylosylphosphotransferase